MISRAALLFIALIPASILCANGLQAGSGVAIILHPGEQFCGHIPASASAKYSFSVEPNEYSMRLVLRWKDAITSPQIVLHSPSGKEIERGDLSNFEQGRDSSSLTIRKPESGKWVAEIKSADVPAKGDDYCILVEFVRDGKEKAPPPAKFNGLYRDYGVDENGDGIYDYVVLKVGLDVRMPGNYMVEGSLYDVNNGLVVPISYGDDLQIGSQALELELDEMRSPGPYRLKNLVLYDEAGDVVDRSPGGYLTGKYSDLRMYDAELNGNYSDYGSDIDGDGLYDYLTLDVGVDVYAPGNYSLWGLLCDSKGKGLVWSLGFAYLLPGIHTMHVDFDGKTLWMGRINGPYKLCNLSLESGDSFKENLTGEDTVLGTYVTRPYNYTEFVSPA